MEPGTGGTMGEAGLAEHGKPNKGFDSTEASLKMAALLFQYGFLTIKCICK